MGAMFMLQHSYKNIPLLFKSTKEVWNAAAALTGSCTHGGIITDTMGLGKTFLAFLFMNYTAKHVVLVEHKPTLVLVPNEMVFGQWLDAINHSFPNLGIILVHSKKASESRYANCWVPVYLMKQAPDDLKSWPKHLKYIFNVINSRALKTVLISTYNTFANRTISTMQGKRERKIFTSKWKDKIGMVILNKRH